MCICALYLQALGADAAHTDCAYLQNGTFKCDHLQSISQCVRMQVFTLQGSYCINRFVLVCNVLQLQALAASATRADCLTAGWNFEPDYP